MYRTPEKSSSKSNLRQISSNTESSPSASFTNTRTKRKRLEESPIDFCEFKNEIKDMLSSWMSQQNSERIQITSSLKTIEDSMAFMTAQFEDMRKKMEEMECEIYQNHP
ncbi:unnamed protein product [Parnassius apollo]|uniref:(apollo) hypothetical protein n=1 Tax=Parnassius apollo TaxID=110799 RepID=A0A8S3WIT3_PARAO|nr:unnamed protein product [Parnassius apollo]